MRYIMAMRSGLRAILSASLCGLARAVCVVVVVTCGSAGAFGAGDNAQVQVPQSPLPFGSNSWQEVRAEVVNQRTTPLHAVVDATVEDVPWAKFRAMVTVPPQAVRRVTWDVHTGESTTSEAGRAANAALAARTREVRVSLADGQDALRLLHQNVALQRRVMKPLVMVEVTGEGDLQVGRLMTRAATLAGASVERVFARREDWPDTLAGWSSVSHVVLGADMAGLSPRQTAAFRGWLAAGGMVLVIQPGVTESWGRKLFGGAWQHEVIGQVQVADATGEGVEPVVMSRVLPGEGDSVVARHGGWPVVLQRRYGSGAMLVMTVNAAAWPLQETAVRGKPGSAAMLNEDQLAAWALRFLPRPEEPLSADLKRKGESERPAGPYAAMQQDIAYTVTPRSLVLGLLAGTIVAYGGCIFWLRRRAAGAGVWAWPAAIGVVTVLGTAALGVTSRSFRGNVPVTFTSLAKVQPGAERDAAMVRASCGIYSPETTRGTVMMARDVWVWPRDHHALGGDAILARQADGGLAWQNLRLGANTFLPMEVRAMRTTGTYPRAQVRFGDGPVTGRVEAAAPLPARLGLLHTAMGVMPCEVRGDGVIVVEDRRPMTWGEVQARAASAGAADNWSAARELLMQPAGNGARPTLLLFSESSETFGVTLPAELNARRLGRVGTEVPVTIERPDAGAKIQVPQGWMTIRMPPMIKGDRQMPPYDPQRREWLPGVSYPASFLLGFVLPAEAKALKPERIVFELAGEFEGRSVSVGLGEAHAMAVRADNLMGQRRFVFDTGALQADASGTIWVSVVVSGESAVRTPPVRWSITHAGLEVQGTVADSAKAGIE